MQTVPVQVLRSWDEALTAGDGWWRDHASTEVRYELIDSWLTGAQRRSLDGSTGADGFLILMTEFNNRFQKYKAIMRSSPPESQRLSLRLTLYRSVDGSPKATASLHDEMGSPLAVESASLMGPCHKRESTRVDGISIPVTSPKPTSTESTSGHPVVCGLHRNEQLYEETGYSCPRCIAIIKHHEKKVSTAALPKEEVLVAATGELAYTKTQLSTLLKRKGAKEERAKRVGWPGKASYEAIARFIREL